jgi:DNA-binding transcriptional ArsR family regulator
MELTLAEKAERQAAMCRIFGNPCRLQILWSLASGELSVNEIASQVGSSLQNVSQHLSLLKRHNLLASRREGQHIYYRIDESALLSDCLAMSTAAGVRLTNEISIQNGGLR